MWDIVLALTIATVVINNLKIMIKQSITGKLQGNWFDVVTLILCLPAMLGVLSIMNDEITKPRHRSESIRLV